MLAFSPFGGSVVIFIPAWRIDMGKYGVGLELSHNLRENRTRFSQEFALSALYPIVSNCLDSFDANVNLTFLSFRSR